jgi:acetoin utilization deacetylase AcuC-like enzyme
MTNVKNDVAFLFHHDCDLHYPEDDHPENHARIKAIIRHLRNVKLFDELLHDEINDRASHYDILRVHHPDYIARVDRLEHLKGKLQIDKDTWASENSHDAIYLSAGAGVMAVKDVMSGAYNKVFCATRPPGHHAEPKKTLGFCFFNNIAIAVQLLRFQYDINKVAVLDFDVHHCNGTVEIFKKNANVMVCSSFQHPHYPDSHTDIDKPHIINTPLTAGTDGSEVKRFWNEQWLPALEKHKPEFIFISAGFDAHAADDMGGLNWHSEDYFWLTQQIVKFADQHCQGRIISMLEGGYHLQALAKSVEMHIRALQGE